MTARRSGKEMVDVVDCTMLLSWRDLDKSMFYSGFGLDFGCLDSAMDC